MQVLFNLAVLPLGREIRRDEVSEEARKEEYYDTHKVAETEKVAETMARRSVIRLVCISVPILAFLQVSIAMGGDLLLQIQYDVSIVFRSDAMFLVELSGAFVCLALTCNEWLGGILDEWGCLALLLPVACIGVLLLFDISLGIPGLWQLIGAEVCLYSSLSGAEGLLLGVMYSATFSDSSFYGSDQVVCISFVLQHISQLLSGPLARALIDHFGRTGYAFSILTGVIVTTVCAICVGVLRRGKFTGQHQSKCEDLAGRPASEQNYRPAG